MSMPGAPQAEPADPSRFPAHDVLMDRIYRHQRHIYDLTRRHYLAGRVRLIRSLNARPNQKILEIGCGTAWNLIRIARRYPGTQLSGLDASAEMLRSATLAIHRAKVSERIHLMHGLAEEVPALFHDASQFDHVIFSYSLSMVSDWNRALSAARKVMRDNGEFHVVDFGDLNALWPAASGLLRAWLRLFHVHPRAEFLQRLESMSGQRTDCSLQILPGRYAFVFKGSKAAISELRR